MNHVTMQETPPGTHILLQELESQLMLKLHHTQDMLSIYKLTHYLTLASTQIKQPKLMKPAILPEILLGTLIPHLELEHQLMHNQLHIQDTLFMYRFHHQAHQLLMLALTQTKQPRLMRHAAPQETQLGTLILLLELLNQLTPSHHHIQDMLSIYKLHQLLMNVLTQIKQLKLMKHALKPETQLGTLTLLQELLSQLMLKLHHTQDIPSTEVVYDQNKQFVYSTCYKQMQPKFVD